MGFVRAGEDITAGAVMVAAKGLMHIGTGSLKEILVDDMISSPVLGELGRSYMIGVARRRSKLKPNSCAQCLRIYNGPPLMMHNALLSSTLKEVGLKFPYG